MAKKNITLLLETLAAVTEEMDCDRPQDMLEFIIANKIGIPSEELVELRRDINNMKTLIGNLGERIDKYEEYKKAKIVNIRDAK